MPPRISRTRTSDRGAKLAVWSVSLALEDNVRSHAARAYCLSTTLRRLTPSRQATVERIVVEGEYLRLFHPVLPELTVVKNQGRSILMFHPLSDVGMHPQLRTKGVLKVEGQANPHELQSFPRAMISSISIRNPAMANPSNGY